MDGLHAETVWAAIEETIRELLRDEPNSVALAHLLAFIEEMATSRDRGPVQSIAYDVLAAEIVGNYPWEELLRAKALVGPAFLKAIEFELASPLFRERRESTEPSPRSIFRRLRR